jgi:hypothetical protein
LFFSLALDFSLCGCTSFLFRLLAGLFNLALRFLFRS